MPKYQPLKLNCLRKDYRGSDPEVSLLKIIDVGKVTLNPHQKPNQFTL